VGGSEGEADVERLKNKVRSSLRSVQRGEGNEVMRFFDLMVVLYCKY